MLSCFWITGRLGKSALFSALWTRRALLRFWSIRTLRARSLWHFFSYIETKGSSSSERRGLDLQFEWPHWALLRSALWGHPRIVTMDRASCRPICPRNSSSPADAYFRQRDPGRNDAFKAVLSRCDIFEAKCNQRGGLRLDAMRSANGFHV